MDISGQKTTERMTHLEAWAHFYAKWDKLPARERRRVPLLIRSSHIRLAQADYLGKRKNKKGEVYLLGSKRVAQILQAVSEAMPETFAYSHHLVLEEWFEVK